MLRIAPDETGREEFALALDEICRAGAQRMLAFALEAEVDAYLDQGRGHRDERGHALVVRNGRARTRSVVTGAGAIEVAAPRVDDRRVDPDTGYRSRFRSSILPPYARRSPKVAEVLPLLYLHGLSTKDFSPALQEFFGTPAGLSPGAITRLTASWSAETEAFGSRDLRVRLRLRLGRWCPLLRAARGRRPAVCAGHGGGSHRRDEGARGGHRRLPGVHRELGGAAEGPPPPRDGRSDACHRRRSPRVLGSGARHLPRDPLSAGLGAQGRERPGCPARLGAGAGAPGPARDLGRRGPLARRASP